MIKSPELTEADIASIPPFEMPPVNKAADAKTLAFAEGVLRQWHVAKHLRALQRKRTVAYLKSTGVPASSIETYVQSRRDFEKTVLIPHFASATLGNVGNEHIVEETDKFEHAVCDRLVEAVSATPETTKVKLRQSDIDATAQIIFAKIVAIAEEWYALDPTFGDDTVIEAEDFAELEPIAARTRSRSARRVTQEELDERERGRNAVHNAHLITEQVIENAENSGEGMGSALANILRGLWQLIVGNDRFEIMTYVLVITVGMYYAWNLFQPILQRDAVVAYEQMQTCTGWVMQTCSDPYLKPVWEGFVHGQVTPVDMASSAVMQYGVGAALGEIAKQQYQRFVMASSSFFDSQFDFVQVAAKTAAYMYTTIVESTTMSKLATVGSAMIIGRSARYGRTLIARELRRADGVSADVMTDARYAAEFLGKNPHRAQTKEWRIFQRATAVARVFRFVDIVAGAVGNVSTALFYTANTNALALVTGIQADMRMRMLAYTHGAEPSHSAHSFGALYSVCQNFVISMGYVPFMPSALKNHLAVERIKSILPTRYIEFVWQYMFDASLINKALLVGSMRAEVMAAMNTLVPSFIATAGAHPFAAGATVAMPTVVAALKLYLDAYGSPEPAPPKAIDYEPEAPYAIEYK
jgi:hypothetical protein